MDDWNVNLVNSMQKKFQIRGQLLIEVPRPFRRQQLTHQQQLKDKEIRKELQALEQKRQEDYRLQEKWKQEKKELQELKRHHEQKDKKMKEQQQALAREIFKLQIRKEQIMSRTDPSISKSKLAVLSKYFKCIPYTAGNRLDKIIFWGGQERYFRLKFLIQFGRDRFLRKSQTQKRIFSNMDRIVLCRKVKFEGQWLMLTIKEIKNFITETSGLPQNRSRLCPTVSFNQIGYELHLYSITGKNWAIKKLYTHQDLISWSSMLKGKEQKIVRQRVSVAETLARQNALKELASQMATGRSNPLQDGNNSNNQLSSGSFSNKKSGLTLGNGSNTVQFEFPSNKILTQLVEDNNESFDTPGNLSSYRKKSSCYSNESNSPKSSQQQSDLESEESCKLDGVSQAQSRRTMRSKSSFCPKSVFFRPTLQQLNKSFLNGIEVDLFPPYLPLLNIVILKDKKQLYLLQEYLQFENKSTVIKNIVFRMKKKVIINKELKNCLFYRIMKVNQFFETKLSQSCDKQNLIFLSSLELPLLFMIKQKRDRKQNGLWISCISVSKHPELKKVLSFSCSFLKETKEASNGQEKEANKEEKGRRMSVNKGGLKNSLSRKSKEFKQKGNMYQSKEKGDNYKKSPFHESKKSQFTAFCPSLIQKFQEFMNTHTISLVNRCFFPHTFVVRALSLIIKVQAKFKQLYQRIKFKAIGSQNTLTYKYLPLSKIFISSLFTQHSISITIIIESLEQGKSDQTIRLTYPKQYETIIKSQIESFQGQGTLEEIREQLNKKIQTAIQLQLELRAQFERERPEKQRKIMKRFIYMFYLRVKVKKNIFFIKKLAVKDRMFVLVIRRDDRFRHVLQCALYDLGVRLNLNGLGRQGSSQMGWQKQTSHTSNKQFGKPYTYQHIHLQEKYFKGIDRKNISDEFLIDHKVFLLKPPKGSNVYYIQRLVPIDINSQQISKAFISIDKEQSSHKQNGFPLSVKSIKCLLNGKKQNVLFSGSNNNRNSNESSQGPNKKKKAKKNSIQSSEGMFLGLIKPTAVRECPPSMYSKASLAESTSNRKQGCRILGNSHESVLYYSLFKGSDIFFYLDIYMVTKTFPQSNSNNYTQNLSRLHRQRLYKKQLEDKGGDLVMRKVAEWLIEHEQQYVVSKDQRTIEDNLSQAFLEGGMSMIKNCLEMIETHGKQRFSLQYLKNGSIMEAVGEKSRTNTFTQ